MLKLPSTGQINMTIKLQNPAEDPVEQVYVATSTDGDVYIGYDYQHVQEQLGVSYGDDMQRPVILRYIPEEKRGTMTEQYDKWKSKLQSNADVLGGTVVFPNTRLSVHHVGAMISGGVSLMEINEDYPFLTIEDLAFSPKFVKESEFKI